MSNPPARTILRDRNRRPLAFKLKMHNEVKYPEWNWRVGLTFSNHVGLDFDGSVSELEIIRYGKKIAYEMHLQKFAVFKTENGYWLIFPKEVGLNTFLEFYDYILLFKYKFEGLDVAHAEISRKYAKTTFRITKKDPDAPFSCKLIGEYDES